MALSTEHPDVSVGAAGDVPEARAATGLGRTWWIGLGVLAGQGAVMLAWSTLLWSRFALTYDYAVYHQAAWLIARGHLDPADTVLRLPFWKNNLELAMWPLALLAAPVLHGPALLWIQDVALVGAEAVAWRWMCEGTLRLEGRSGHVLRLVGLTLLVLDPWVWWATSFDFHMELIALPFAVLTMRDLAHGRPRMWVWVPLVAACGDAEATWLAGIGLGGLTLRGRRWVGLALVAVGAGWVLFSTAVHGDSGGSLTGAYGYLAPGHVTPNVSAAHLAVRIAEHPARVIRALWAQRVDIWANLAPVGVVGLAAPLTAGLALPVLLANELTRGFAAPTFQGVALYVALPIGTVLVLTRIVRRRRRLGGVAAVLVLANVLAWAVVWLPQTPGTWLRVSPAASATLRRALHRIPPSAEVVASQGVVGRFSSRRFVYPILNPGVSIPLSTATTWWIVAPNVGIETESPTDQAAIVSWLAGPLGARLVDHGGGVWVFDLRTPAESHQISLPDGQGTAAWEFPGGAGRSELAGPGQLWRLAATGARGYVLAGDYWRELPGRYRASVTLSATVPVRVELWDATADRLLARRSIAPTVGPERVTLVGNETHTVRRSGLLGVGPFIARFPPPPAGDALEVRVWSPGGGTVDVTSVGLQPVVASHFGGGAG